MEEDIHLKDPIFEFLNNLERENLNFKQNIVKKKGKFSIQKDLTIEEIEESKTANYRAAPIFNTELKVFTQEIINLF